MNAPKDGRCRLCRKPAEEGDELCERCSTSIRETVADLPPLTEDQVKRVVRLLTRD